MCLCTSNPLAREQIASIVCQASPFAGITECNGLCSESPGRVVLPCLCRYSFIYCLCAQSPRSGPTPARSQPSSSRRNPIYRLRGSSSLKLPRRWVREVLVKPPTADPILRLAPIATGKPIELMERPLTRLRAVPAELLEFRFVVSYYPIDKACLFFSPTKLVPEG